MLRNDDCSVLGNVTSSFLSSFLHYKTTKPTRRYTFSSLDKDAFTASMNASTVVSTGCLINTGVLCNFVYNICFSHFSLKKILLL